MAVGVVEIELLETVGALLQRGGDADAVGFDSRQSLRYIVDSEGDVVSAMLLYCLGWPSRRCPLRDWFVWREFGRCRSETTGLGI